MGFLNAEEVVTVFDNFCSSDPLSLACVTQITGKKLTLVQGEIIQESATFGTAFRPNGSSEVMHFAGLSECVSQFESFMPRRDNNVVDCFNLLQFF